VKGYTAQTAGWDLAQGSYVAPPGTTSARVLMYVEALVGTVYVDDIDVRRL
jgi:methenyltetrahydromethanopterin cyclohydrolase